MQKHQFFGVFLALVSALALHSRFNSKMSTAPYGTWKSPVTAELATGSSIRYGGVYAEKESGAVVWLEARPQEQGRVALVRRDKSGAVKDLVPVDTKMNIRTRVHEYGGKALISGEEDGVYYFSNFADQRLYRVSAHDGSIHPVTKDLGDSKVRYADGVYDETRHGILCVRESHTDDKSVNNEVVYLKLDRTDPQKEAEEIVLASGADFVAGPRMSKDGKSIAWVQWNHPNMPWDDTTLHIAAISENLSVTETSCIAGEGAHESITSPVWGPHDNKLYYVSDAASGWWNLYRYEGNGTHTCLLEKKNEFAEPAWVLGGSSFMFSSEAEGTVFYTRFIDGGFHRLMKVTLGGDGQPAAKTHVYDELSYTSFVGMSMIGNNKILMAGGSPSLTNTVFEFEPNTGNINIIARSSEPLDPKYLSIPTHISFPTTNGKEGYAMYYPPKNDDYRPVDGEKPPLLVKIHGGPTGSCSSSFNAQYQYWTSRGVAIADVNYGGSTGYGREYRDRLKGQWGVVDIEDCCNCAKFLAESGKADDQRLTIDGGSAGGYTTLAAIAFRDVFKAGASLFGVADMELLAQETHKFESRYLDSLIGPYPEMKDVYYDRSPINHIDKITVPIILFQGLEDKIVPPNQATKMFEALKDKGVATAIELYPGEQHGFRMAKNQKRTLEGQFHFFAKVLGYTPADPLDEPLEIHNL